MKYLSILAALLTNIILLIILMYCEVGRFPTGLKAFTSCLYASCETKRILTNRANFQDKPSLSDLVVGTTTRAAFSQLKDAEVSSFPRIEAYVKRLEGFDAFAQAAAGVDEFIKVS